jgi:hypothetical protein
MAQKYQSADFGSITVPGAYTRTVVQSTNTGNLQVGILALVGEADEGAPASSETDLPVFGPDQEAEVIKKYGSGPIVDAFSRAVKASNDTEIVNSFTRAIIVKTNASTQASTSLARAGLSAWATLDSQNYGPKGNQIATQVSAAVAEVGPETQTFTWVPQGNQTVILGTRTNGGAVDSITVPAVTTSTTNGLPSVVRNQLWDLGGAALPKLIVTGGLEIKPCLGLGGSETLTVTRSGYDIVIQCSTTLTFGFVSPAEGDTLIIPALNDYGVAAASSIVGGANANRGSYVITYVDVGGQEIHATKIRDWQANDGASLTTPANVSAATIVGDDDILVYGKMSVTPVSGTERSSILTGLVGQTVQGVASGSSLTLVLQTGAVWAALPRVGDKVYLPATAPATWRASNQNVGWYEVTAATSGTAAGASTITMTMLSSYITDAIVPTSFAPTAIAATTDLRVVRPVIDGVGKAWEFFDGGGTSSLAATPYKLQALVPGQNVDFISTGASPLLHLSSTEYRAELTNTRSIDSVEEDLAAGGEILFTVGYSGGGLVTTATMTVSGTTLTTTVSGGTGSNLSVNLKNLATVKDLVNYLNAQTGYKAVLTTVAYGQLPLLYTKADGSKATILDKATWGIASAHGSMPGRVKKDAYAMWSKVTDNSVLVEIDSVPDKGLPEVQGLVYLTNGAKGATTNASIQAALVKLGNVACNFVVPLFSQDAVDDYAEGLTESTSSYTISQVHDLVKSHCLTNSTIKARRWRQGLLSVKDSFTNAKLAAQTVANFRCLMAFQDVRASNAQGESVQFQPWMASVVAASMQSGGFYKPIVKRFANVQGVLMADGSYTGSYSEKEDALAAGLLFMESVDSGGFRWVSDQTTYSVDSNFVYNSLQAVYMMDTLAALVTDRTERRFVGYSLADVSASAVAAYVRSVFYEAYNLKIIAASDGAPNGYKDLKIKITAPSIEVSAVCALATGIYFVLNTLSLVNVEQSA